MSQRDRAEKKSVSKKAKAYIGSCRSGYKETKSLRKAKIKAKIKAKKDTTRARRRLNQTLTKEEP